MTGMTRVRAGIIAAGHGQRLGGSTGAVLKPLVQVAGRPLVERVLASLSELQPLEVVIIINDASVAVRDHVSRHSWPFPIRWVVETTASSMHSFLRVVETLAGSGDGGPFIVSTVDTVARPGAYAAFAEAAMSGDADLTLAVATPLEDDETPLLVRVAADRRRIQEIGVSRAASDAALLATTGYYAVRPSVLREAAAAREAGLPALRLFLAHLLRRGYRLEAVEVPAAVDVDSPADVRAAETFLGGGAA